MNNDLISREDLKKYKFTTQIANGVELEDIEVVPVSVIDNAPTAENTPRFIAYADGRIEQMKHFVHVTINDPKYGEVDGWLDKARQVLFTDAVTTEFAKRVYGWTWKENEK